MSYYYLSHTQNWRDSFKSLCNLVIRDFRIPDICGEIPLFQQNSNQSDESNCCQLSGFELLLFGGKL